MSLTISGGLNPLSSIQHGESTSGAGQGLQAKETHRASSHTSYGDFRARRHAKGTQGGDRAIDRMNYQVPLGTGECKESTSGSPTQKG